MWDQVDDSEPGSAPTQKQWVGMIPKEMGMNAGRAYTVVNKSIYSSSCAANSADSMSVWATILIMPGYTRRTTGPFSSVSVCEGSDNFRTSNR